MLEILDIDVRAYAATLKATERENLADSFHSHPDGCQVIICSYLVSPYGLNLHGHCRNVLFFEPPPNASMEQQVIGRVKRVGQRRCIRIIRLSVKNSFNDCQNANLIVKALPSLMAELNLDIWGKEEDDEVVLGDYVIHKAELVPANHPSVLGLGLAVLEPDELLIQIQRQLLGQQVCVDPQVTVAYTKSKRPRYQR